MSYPTAKCKECGRTFVVIVPEVERMLGIKPPKTIKSCRDHETTGKRKKKNPGYGSPEAVTKAKKQIRDIMKRYGDTGKTNWYLLGSAENAKAVGLKDFHKLKGLDHIGFGDFKDSQYQYIRVADTDAGRLMRRVPLVRSNPGQVLCRCCGKPVYNTDGHPIHTKCIPKHWGKHAKGINASRCKEFGRKSRKNPTVGERLEMIASSDSSPDWEKDQVWMKNLLHRIGFPKARIEYGVVYLEGYGRPSSIQSVAKQILESSK